MHYDFGMRTIKTVLKQMEIQKIANREKENENEIDMCMRILISVNVPKLLQEDIQIFYGIITDIFPGIDCT